MPENGIKQDVKSQMKKSEVFEAEVPSPKCESLRFSSNPRSPLVARTRLGDFARDDIFWESPWNNRIGSVTRGTCAFSARRN